MEGGVGEGKKVFNIGERLPEGGHITKASS